MLFLSNPADKKKIEKCIVSIKKHLSRLQPSEIHHLSYFILALDRFPLAITNLIGTATFTTPRTDGNYAWVDVEFSESAFKLNCGEYFSEGYYETHNIYEANFTEPYPVGDIDEWLAYADIILAECTMSFDILSEDEDIDWDNDYFDPEINDEHIKEQLSYLGMLGLAATYYEWIEDPNFGEKRVLQFKKLANSILLIANEVGPTWDPPDPSELSLTGFLGREIIRD